MGWPFQYGRTVTVTNHTSNPRTQTRTIDEDRTGPVESCAWDPGTTNATFNPAAGTTTTPRFYGPYDIDVDPNSTIAIAGVPGEWEVDGEVLRWRNDLTGTEACSEVHLIRKRGSV